MLYALGGFLLETFPVSAQEFEHDGEYAHAEHQVLGAAPIYEDTGEGRRTMKLTAKLFPLHFGGLGALEALEAMRRAGAPQHLMRGDGKPLGWVLIEKVTEKHETLHFDGVGKEISVSIDLRQCDDAPDAGSLLDTIIGIFG